jgi:hypothetical protein
MGNTDLQLLIYYFTLVALVESLSDRMIKLMHWLYLTENNKFKEFTIDLRAELYYFLMLRRAKLHPDKCGN